MASELRDNTYWEAFDRELDAWGADGRIATFWWRDDDAATPTDALRRLLALMASAEVPLALAVIPARLADGVDEIIAEAPTVRILQHGYAHANHRTRGTGQGACELGMERGVVPVLDELAAGRRILEAAFHRRVAPLLVPPWNRIDGGITRELPAIGFRGLSAFGPRPSPFAVPGLIQINAHCDPISWKGGKRFAGLGSCIGAFVDNLQTNRKRPDDAVEPTGLLTHHLDLDEEAWGFTAELIRRVREHPAACFAAVDQLFPME